MTIGDLKYIIEQFEEDDDIFDDTEVVIRVHDNWYESMDVLVTDHNGSADQFIIEARTTRA
jgi:hypothetical protein